MTADEEMYVIVEELTDIDGPHGGRSSANVYGPFLSKEEADLWAEEEWGSTPENMHVGVGEDHIPYPIYVAMIVRSTDGQ